MLLAAGYGTERTAKGYAEARGGRVQSAGCTVEVGSLRVASTGWWRLAGLGGLFLVMGADNLGRVKRRVAWVN